MKKAYILSITTNATKPFTVRFLMGILIMVAVSLLFDIAMYGIFSTGTQAAWTKTVIGVLGIAESFAIIKFWWFIRG